MNNIITLIVFGVLFTIACNRDCQYTEEVSITATTPSSANVNQTIEFNLDYGVNGCGGTPRLIEEIDGNNRVLTLEIDVIAPSCSCTEQLIFRQYPYSFKPTEAGTYTFEFVRTTSDNLLDTIIVQ